MNEVAGRARRASEEAEVRPGVADRVRFVRTHRLYLPRYWWLAMRYVWRFRIRRRHIHARWPVFVRRSAEVTCRRGLGHMEIGRWVWVGDGDAIRCHEGSVRIGDRVVLGRNVTVDAYLDVEVGEDCLLADSVLVTDFDHRYGGPGHAHPQAGHHQVPSPHRGRLLDRGEGRGAPRLHHRPGLGHRGPLRGEGGHPTVLRGGGEPGSRDPAPGRPRLTAQSGRPAGNEPRPPVVRTVSMASRYESHVRCMEEVLP